MRARVEHGRIRVTLGDDLDEEARLQLCDQIAQAIGSARTYDPVDKRRRSDEDDRGLTAPEVRQISCALSIHNFRKLKKLGCQLDQDPHTKEVVGRMRLELEQYEAEAELGALIKAGKLEPPPYTFKVKPFQHQPMAWLFLRTIHNPALFGDCGVGKTFMSSTMIDSLIKEGRKVVALVICPVNLIRDVWQADIAKFTDCTSVGLREPKAVSVRASDYDEKDDPPADQAELTRRRRGRATDPAARKKARLRASKRHSQIIQARFDQTADFYIINPENLRTDIKEKRVRALCQRLRQDGRQIYLFIDESSMLKSRTSRTYKSIKRIRDLCSWATIMSGTPSPNRIEDLWAQFSILDDGMTLQPSFIDYRWDTSREITLRGVTYKDKQGKEHNVKKWQPRPGAPLQVYRTIEPRMLRFRTEDCIDLPPKRFIMRHVEMSQEQTDVYDQMEDMLFTELEGQPVTARVAAAKMIKLREVTGGFIRTDAGKDIPLGKDAPKMVELDHLLEQSIADKLGDSGPPSKALVWANYQWETQTLVRRYSARYGAKGLFGGISSGAKDRAIDLFWNDPSCRLLICHPASVGHGLNLTPANYIFYYSLSYDFEEFYQSYRRTARPGQKRAMTYYFLVHPNTIDEELIDANRSKKNLSDLVTDGKFSREQILQRRSAQSDEQISIEWDLPENPLESA